MYVLSRFSLDDMHACSEDIRELGSLAADVDVVADRVVRFFYEQFIDAETGERALALVRLFKTRSYQDLHPDSQQFVSETLLKRGEKIKLVPNMPCLSLTATAGDEEHWNNPRKSRHHKAAPLISREFVSNYPMVARFIARFGLTLSAPIELELSAAHVENCREGNDEVGLSSHYSCCVFWAADASDHSLNLDSGKFVQPYGIKSVLGFGGVLRPGAVFVVTMFSKVQITNAIAARFQPIALSTKNVLLDVLRSNSVNLESKIEPPELVLH
ncbi:MAG TPA: hypothetical protein V6C72_02580 [Chroococcales cyanobacterium]